MPNISLFEDERLTLRDSIDLFRSSILAHALDYRWWAVAFSGGKRITDISLCDAVKLDMCGIIGLFGIPC